MEVLPTLEHPNTIIFTKAFSRFAGAPEDDDILVLFVVLFVEQMKATEGWNCGSRNVLVGGGRKSFGAFLQTTEK